MPVRNTKTKLPTVTRGGKDFVKYDPLIALDVVEAIADGKTLKEITKSPFPVTKHTFLQWVATVPDLQKAYLTALRTSARSFEEMALEAAEALYKGPAGKEKIAATNTYISQLRWSATRRDPTNYSDKGNTQVVVPVTINTPLNLGTGLKKGDVEDNSIYNLSISEPIEDGEFSEVEEGDALRRDDRDHHDGKEENPKKPDFKAMLRADEPVEGTERQPILESMKKKPGAPTGPRKRVLTPRIKDNG